MGLFEEAGRRFERFKQGVTAAAGETAEFECGDCGEPLFAEQDACPECGSHAVVRPSPPEQQAEPEPERTSESPSEASAADHAANDAESEGNEQPSVADERSGATDTTSDGDDRSSSE